MIHYERGIEPPRVYHSRGGPDRTGSISGSHLPEHPAVIRIVPTHQGDPGEPLLADGVIFVGDRTETLSAITAFLGSRPTQDANPKSQRGEGLEVAPQAVLIRRTSLGRTHR